MDRRISIAVVLSAQDRMSGIISGAVNRSQAKLSAMAQKSYAVGRSASLNAAAGAAIIATPIKAFADLEDAGLRLKSVLMRDGGIVPEKIFKSLNDQAIILGNKLPGTTADFQNLYATMLEQGTPAKAILSGVGEAAAYLAVQLKMPTDQAGILASRLRLQMGIADKEMMQFMDIMARIKNVGVDPTEMQYAFGRSAGAMKLLNVQGLQASKTLGVLYSMLIREGGATGETAGTGISRIMNEIMNPVKMAKFTAGAKEMGLQFEFFRNGKFLGMENFVAQLTKFSGMDPEKITKLLTPLTGGEGTDNQFMAALSKMGVDGYNKMTSEIAHQATLKQKVDVMLDSLRNKWEAGLGTFTNSLAAFAGTFAPVLKSLADLLGKVSVKLQGFIQHYPNLSKWVGIAALAFIGLNVGIAGGAFAFGAFVKNAGLAVQAAKWFYSFGRIGTILNFIGEAAVASGMAIGRWAILFFTRGIPAMASFTATIWANAAAWLANPATYIILAIIAAVAALIAIGILVYKNWDKIISWFSDKWIIMKAGISGMIAVFGLFLDVIVGVGKALVGAFTFDTTMMVDGAKQAAAAVSKIANGGITMAFAQGVGESLKKSNATVNANGDVIRNQIKPVIQPRLNTPQTTTNHYEVNFHGIATNDPKSMADKFNKYMKDHQSKSTRLAYK